MSIHNISDPEPNETSKMPEYLLFQDQKDPSDYCHEYRRPSKVHYARYQFRKIMGDKKLRFLLIMSIIILKALMALTIFFIIPGSAVK